MLIVNLVPYGQGWVPINHMVRLAAELLEAELIEPNEPGATAMNRLVAVLTRRRRVRGGERCLLICSQPRDLIRVLDIERWRSRFDFLAAWVIDSFWLDWIPRSIRLLRPFDHLFVTSAEDLDQWRALCGVPTTCLGWGADVLRLGSANPSREWDLLRVGRQPPQWDDDEVTAQAARTAGVTFHPRPGGAVLTPFQNQQFLMQTCSNSKFLLAFSNIANPTSYTHPHRQYLTGRWVDALACGAVVAGICPREPSIDALLWPAATLEFDTVDRAHGMNRVVAAVSRWKPAVAAENHARSLRRLDWRWRFKLLADTFGVLPATLLAELATLDAAIEAHPVPVG